MQIAAVVGAFVMVGVMAVWWSEDLCALVAARLLARREFLLRVQVLRAEMNDWRSDLEKRFGVSSAQPKSGE